VRSSGIWRAFVTLTIAGLLAACAGRTPTGPSGSSLVDIATGPQVLRITLQSPCASSGGSAGLVPSVSTRVTVTRVNSEWVATGSSATAGDVELRFHAVSAGIIAGTMSVAGTIKGKAIHMPELSPTPAWDSRVDFGSDGRATLDGVAFAPGAFGATTSGVDGTGAGSITLSDGAGHMCPGTAFSWIVAPQPPT
jgi:hypothetical protein